MSVKVKKWGNSAAVRIPAAVMAAANLSLDQDVEVREESGKIVIERVRSRKYKLADLLKGMTPENQHPLVDFGPPQGKEIF